MPAVTKSVVLSCAVALTVASVLLSHRSDPNLDQAEAGIVYVYFPLLCAEPGDTRDCHEIPSPERPSFESMEACAAHANSELKQRNNPRLIANCVLQREG
jgi:hypothetical protein